MAKRKRNQSSRDDENYVVKNKRKFNILAFILCVLIAFVIWLYASNLEDKNAPNLDQPNGTVEDSNG